MRIAWFSPMPPSRSGIAAYSAEVLPLLRSRLTAIDVYVDRDPWPAEHDVFSAHDFVWRHRRNPYDLTVYQLGNALCHGYMWAYLLRYPGLVVLHDAQLHQARASWLLRRAYPRYADYPIEFAATEPHAPPEIAHVFAAGLGEPAFYQHWPMVRFVLERARLAVVHSDWLRRELAQRYPNATLDTVEMGVADSVAPQSDRVRRRHQIPKDAILVAAYGGITPEKRIPPILHAIGALRDRIPNLRLMLVGERHEHYDVHADAERHGVADVVHVTGFVADDELPSYLAAADICCCLRWPTNRETSASWLRCLAAGKATVVTALAQYANLAEIAVQVDVLDEDRELPRALEALARDEGYRTRLGAAARQHWARHHRLEDMADGYARVIARAAGLPAPHPTLPLHMRDDGSSVLRSIGEQMGVSDAVANLLD